MEKYNWDVCYFSGRLLWYFMISSGLWVQRVKDPPLLVSGKAQNYLGRKRSFLWLHVTLSPLSMKRGKRNESISCYDFLSPFNCIPLTRREEKQKQSARKAFLTIPFTILIWRIGTWYVRANQRKSAKNLHIFFTIFTEKTHPIFLIAPKWFISCSMLGTFFSSPAPSWII